MTRAMSSSKPFPALIAVCICLFGYFGPAHVAMAEQDNRERSPRGGFSVGPLFYPPGPATSYFPHEGKPVDLNNPWKPLQGGGYHDPENPAIDNLQNPAEAMRDLPRARTGNYIDWVAALKSGVIQPRADVDKTGEMELSDIVVTLKDTRTMPTVTFSHAVHTEWLACSNCHDGLFKRQAGATDIRMIDIFNGKSCGVCHGKVAFPPDLCFRCHNGPRPQPQD